MINIGFDQQFPFHTVSECRGGEGGGADRQTLTNTHNEHVDMMGNSMTCFRGHNPCFFLFKCVLFFIITLAVKL